MLDRARSQTINHTKIIPEGCHGGATTGNIALTELIFASLTFMEIRYCTLCDVHFMEGCGDHGELQTLSWMVRVIPSRYDNRKKYFIFQDDGNANRSPRMVRKRKYASV